MPKAQSNGRHPRLLYTEDSEPSFRLVESILPDCPATDLAWAALRYLFDEVFLPA